MAIAALTGNPIGGALVATNEDGKMQFWSVQVFCGVVMVLGSACWLAARVTLVGWKVVKKV